MPPDIHESGTMLAHPCTTTLETERRSWLLHQRALLQRHGRAVTLGIALRHVRSAPTQLALLAMIEEILVHHMGVSAFEVIDTDAASPHVLAARGLAVGDSSRPPLARVPLGSGPCTLGALVIHALAPTKDGLDPFDHELLAALGPQIAVALHSVRQSATRPTVRPPRLSASGDA
jgi:hypothetical protein